MKYFDLISYHPGRQHNLEQACELHKAFDSFRHVTSLYVDRKTVARCSRLSPRLGASLRKRTSDLASAFVDTYPQPEFRLLLKRFLGAPVGTKDYIDRNKVFQEWLLRRYAPPAVCIGFDTASREVFSAWKHKSFLILDLSIAPPQYKLQLAGENNFDREQTSNLVRGDEMLYDLYARELELADLILCGSQFVKDACRSLGVAEQKLVVLPYGVDLKRFHGPAMEEKSRERTKVAFVGSVNYRKGADVLLKAWEKLAPLFPDAELHYYGNVQMAVPASPHNVFFHGFLNQEELIAELRTAHISVLPTFFEGSSLAVYQSMAMGLAVVTTPNAGSVVGHNRNGLLVPYGNAEELYACLQQLLGDAHLRERLSLQAVKDVRRYTWSAYGNELAALLKKVVHRTQQPYLVPV